MTREEAIADILRLKQKRTPANWKQIIKQRIGYLWHLDHPKCVEHTEDYHRPVLNRKFSDAPRYDDMSDESEP